MLFDRTKASYSTVASSGFWNKRDVSCRVRLLPTDKSRPYLVIPSTYHPGIEGSFTISLHVPDGSGSCVAMTADTALRDQYPFHAYAIGRWSVRGTPSPLSSSVFSNCPMGIDTDGTAGGQPCEASFARNPQYALSLDLSSVKSSAVVTCVLFQAARARQAAASRSTAAAVQSTGVVTKAEALTALMPLVQTEQLQPFPGVGLAVFANRYALQAHRLQALSACEQNGSERNGKSRERRAGVSVEVFKSNGRGSHSSRAVYQ